MKIGIGKVRVNRFEFNREYTSDVDLDDPVRNGSLSLGMPDDINEDDEKIIIKVKMEIELKDNGLVMNAEIGGFFEVPNYDYQDKDSENTKDLIDNIVPPLMNKFKWYYGLFFDEVNDFVSIPDFDFKF